MEDKIVLREWKGDDMILFRLREGSRVKWEEIDLR